MLDTIVPRIFSEFLTFYTHTGVSIGLCLEGIFIVGIASIYYLFPYARISIFFDIAFESVYHFFEDILGNEEKKGLKLYITLLFFIILLSNFLGIFLEFLSPIFGEKVEHFIQIPTTDINFNIAMAIIGILIVLKEQYVYLGLKHFVYEFIPIFGKNYITYTRGKLPFILDTIMYVFIKIFDIIISLFLGALEIIGLFAKVISLSFRLFGNITSGGIILMMLMTGISSLSLSLFNIDFPVGIPLVIYFQEILVACIQAFVFPLLIAIFIKVAKLH